MPAIPAGFELDARLLRDTVPLMWLGLCEMRLMNDRRWPWLVLVPQRPGAVEIHDLTPLDQTMLTFETNTVSKALKELTRCHKINIGALGNIVSQLHVHIVARHDADPAWPGPVWGHGQREPYEPGAIHQFIDSVRSKLAHQD
jgi:diadenosine tetraphosphate (Ap4A) HIT family hydrolase